MSNETRQVSLPFSHVPEVPAESRWREGLVTEPPARGFIELERYKYTVRRVSRDLFSMDNSSKPPGVCQVCARDQSHNGRGLYGYAPGPWGVACEDADEKGWVWLCSWMCFDRLLEHRLLVQEELELMGVFGIRPRNVPAWFMDPGLARDLGVCDGAV